jgi:enoyl-CoA hydratase/carnithine racemase
MITTEVQDGVCVITLDRIERRNALGTEMMLDLKKALDAADRDPGIGAIVLTGRDGTFCAGSDLKELGGMDLAGMASHESCTASLVRQFPLMSKPIVAAVEGHAIGGGFVLASACDIVVASRASQWLLAEVPNGWLPPWGLSFLVARVGPVQARRLTLGHERLDGVKVHEAGIADYLADAGEALRDALAHARALAALPVAAVRSTKAFFAPFVMDRAEYLVAIASVSFVENCTHPEAQRVLQKFGVKNV